MTAPVLDAYSCQYGVTGLLLNGVAFPDGTIIDITNIDGLDSAPAKSSTASYEGRDGGILNAVNEDMRTIVITGMVYAGTNSVFVTLEALKDNFALSDTAQPLYLQPYGVSPRMVNCKSLGVKYSWSTAMRTGTTPIVITLQAEDPSIYGTNQYMVQGNLITAAVGYSWSRPWSYSFGGGNPVGLTLLTNAGTKPTGFYATIQNQAVTNPRLISDTAGELFVSTNITIGTTDRLVFDFYTQSLFLNGQSRHAAVVNEGWFSLAKGQNSIRFQADSSIAATINYTYYDAYR